MSECYYKKYTRNEMSKIGKEIGFYFIETSNGDNYIIAKTDLVDFIMCEADRCGHAVNIYAYVPSADIEEPILTTCGYFLNSVNQNLRSEIIDDLIAQQTGEKPTKAVKIFDNEVFLDMKLEDFGDKEGENLQFNKFFKKYYV